MPKINILQLGTQGVDMKSSPLLVGAKNRVHSATNLIFDEGVVRTRPGFVYTTTEAVGQFNGAASFRPRKGLSAAPLSQALSGIAVVVDGVPILGCHPLGETFGCCEDVHVFQAENYLIFQSPSCDTFWWDGMTLTRSPGMNEVHWTEDELPIKELEHVAPVADFPDCEVGFPESGIELRFLVLDCDTREPIPEPLWEIRHNNHKAYSGMGDEEGRFQLNPVPRSYNYDVRKLGYIPAEDVPFVISGVGEEYEFDTCLDPHLIITGDREILVLLCRDPDYSSSSSSGSAEPPGSNSNSDSSSSSSTTEGSSSSIGIGSSDSSSSSSSSDSSDSSQSGSSTTSSGESSSSSSSSSDSSSPCCVQVNFVSPLDSSLVCAEMDYIDGAYVYEDISLILDEGLWFVVVGGGAAEFLTAEECPHGSLTYDGLEITFGPCVGCSSSSSSSSSLSSSSSSGSCNCDSITIEGVDYTTIYTAQDASGDMTQGVNTTLHGTPTDLVDVTTNPESPWFATVVGVASDFDLSFGVCGASSVNITFAVVGTPPVGFWQGLFDVWVNGVIYDYYALASAGLTETTATVPLSGVCDGDVVTIVLATTDDNEEGLAFSITVDSITP